VRGQMKDFDREDSSFVRGAKIIKLLICQFLTNKSVIYRLPPVPKIRRKNLN